ncbi:hypothetical protein VP142E351_P0059 [Vibrio phage 142E35-1]|nr:hypothetical protein VP142E351_P0059 [Vibrio phage 142E35-1]
MIYTDFCHKYILNNSEGIFRFNVNNDGSVDVTKIARSKGKQINIIHKMLMSTHLLHQPYSYVMKKQRPPNGMYLDMRRETHIFPPQSRYGQQFLYEWKNDYLVVVGRNTLGLQMTEILDTIHNNPDDYLGLHKWTI